MVEATQQDRSTVCTACFSGHYPIKLPEADKLGKDVLELQFPVADPRDPASADEVGTLDVDRVRSGASAGATDAVRRP